MNTIEQRRAANALDCVKKLSSDDDEQKNRYRSYVERLGPAIIMNGLGQALATERAAAGESNTGSPEGMEHMKLYNFLGAWLCHRCDGVYAEQMDVLAAIMSHCEADYLRAQSEALAWLRWHKKFCRSFLPRLESEE